MEHGLLLLSGGFDSPVAGYLAQKKSKISAIHFTSKPFLGDESEKKTFLLSKKLGFSELFVVNLGPAFKAVAEMCEHKYYFVLTKRLMLKVAEKIALENNFSFLLTGENIGQVSSQTLSNFATISKAIKIPVLRPLIHFDKQDIIKLAEKIEIASIAIGPETCDFFGPKHPATISTNEQMLFEESKIDLEKLISDSLTEIKTNKF